MISETKLNKWHKLQFKDYDIVRTDRPGALKGGGSAIMIKNSIQYTQIFTPTSMNNEITEFTIIKIKLKNNFNLYVVSLYANNESSNSFISEINKLFEQLNLSSPNNYYVISGDLNSRHTCWGDRSCNYKGRALKLWYDQYSHQNKLNIFSPDSPTFVPSETVLDLCLIDTRITLPNLINDKIKTLDFDSDHKALIFDIKIDNQIDIDILKNTKHNFIFKKTKWEKFKKHLNANSKIDIPDNKNLSQLEINSAIDQITKSIQNSIETIVPKYKACNNTLLYVNSKIKKLSKQKSKLITALNKYRQENFFPGVRYIQFLLETVNINLKSEFKKAYSAYWDTQHKTINYRESHEFFPKVNRWFRQKNSLDIEPLHISEKDINIINRVCNTENLKKIDDKLIINDPLDKLNVIGSFYERINSPRYTNFNTKVKKLVTEKTDEFKAEFQRKKDLKITVTEFSDQNPATNPVTDLEYPYFCSIASLHIILKNSSNKSSAGLDKILPIILKHLPTKIIRA